VVDDATASDDSASAPKAGFNISSRNSGPTEARGMTFAFLQDLTSVQPRKYGIRSYVCSERKRRNSFHHNGPWSI